ncbi:hypothetical protein SLE2022_372710 [Rubroshorea leprosula]
MAFLRTILLLLFFTSSFSSFPAQSIRKELRDKEVQSKIDTLSHSVHSNRVDPSRVTQLLWQPRVFLYSNFLTDDECDHIISLARSIRQNVLRNNGSENAGTDRILESSETQLNLEDNVLAMIEERISAWTFLPKEYGKPLQVLQYGPEEAGQNLDDLGNRSLGHLGNRSTLALNEPLMAVIVLYLSNVTRGGEILFPDSEVKSKIWSDCTKTSNILKPVKGNAILFFTRYLNASPDEHSSHSRCPVLDGEMWFATKFLYIRPVKQPKHALDLDDNDCTDEEESCPEWAALGECQKNPVFMIGSPDYYGTCRKSCNVC